MIKDNFGIPHNDIGFSSKGEISMGKDKEGRRAKRNNYRTHWMSTIDDVQGFCISAEEFISTNDWLPPILTQNSLFLNA